MTLQRRARSTKGTKRLMSQDMVPIFPDIILILFQDMHILSMGFSQQHLTKYPYPLVWLQGMSPRRWKSQSTWPNLLSA